MIGLCLFLLALYTGMGVIGAQIPWATQIRVHVMVTVYPALTS